MGLEYLAYKPAFLLYRPLVCGLKNGLKAQKQCTRRPENPGRRPLLTKCTVNIVGKRKESIDKGGKNWLIGGKNCFLLYKTIFLTS